MKKAILIVAIATSILMNGSVSQAKYEPLSESTILTCDNTTNAQGKVVSVKKKKGRRIVKVRCTSGKYNNRTYKITLDTYDWKRESFKKGNKVSLIMYKSGTKKVSDDTIVNIHK